MKKSLIVLITLFIPFSAQASWWNPADWTKSPKINIISTTTNEEIQKTTIKTVVKEVPIERIVEKKVSDPVIIAENAVLRTEIAQLKAQLAQCAVPAMTSDTGYSEFEYQQELEKELKEKKKEKIYNELSYTEKINSLQQKIIDIKTQYYKDVQAINSSGGNYSQSYAEGLINKKLKEANIKIEQINLQIQQLQLDQAKLEATKSTRPSTTQIQIPKLQIPVVGASVSS